MPLVPIPPVPFPLTSGLYVWSQQIPPLIPPPVAIPIPHPDPGSSIPGGLILAFSSEELRLDVDGRYPQMTASGTLRGFIASQTHWIASLTASGTNTWTGAIWLKDGATASFPYTTVQIKVVKSLFPASQTATVIYSGGGPSRMRIFKYKSSAFHPVDFEFDFATGEALSAGIDTHAHPNRPVGLPQETLTIPKVFQRAGFAVTTTPGAVVPIADAGANARWSDRRCTMRCRPTGPGSPPPPSGRCGSSSPRSMSRVPAWAASCSTTSARTIARARPSSMIRSSHRHRPAIRTRRPGFSG